MRLRSLTSDRTLGKIKRIVKPILEAEQRAVR
jgi:hypothetical protein